MPTAKYFDSCPPFPLDAPVAEVASISFVKLQQNDEHESSRLFDACRSQGFFSLDLRQCDEGLALLQDAAAMFELNTDTFALGRETLKRYAFEPPRILEGYKAVGMQKTDEGKFDTTEMFTIGQDDILGQGPTRAKPDVVEARKDQCRSFLRHAHSVTTVILNSLDKRLGLPIGTLISSASIDQPSATSIRLISANPVDLAQDQKLPLGGHTDIGIITLLFNVVGGLQILTESDGWRYVRPRQGCAVVNLGDTLVEWTGDLLRSNLHRVHLPPGEQASAVRQSLAYLVRPSHGKSMRRLQGSSVIPALGPGEEEDTRSVDDWAAWRAVEILKGHMKPQTRGGVSVPMAKSPAQTEISA